jgi:hypothetical protein
MGMRGAEGGVRVAGRAGEPPPPIPPLFKHTQRANLKLVCVLIFIKTILRSVTAKKGCEMSLNIIL